MRSHWLVFTLALAAIGCSDDHAATQGPCAWRPAPCVTAGMVRNSETCVCEAVAGQTTGAAGNCAPLPCPSGAPWDAASCSCKAPSGAAGNCAPLPCPSNAPWNAGSCSCQATTAAACEIESEFAKRAALKPVDCGELKIDANTEAREHGRQCVVDAIAAHHAFQFLQWRMGIDSRLATAFVSAGFGDFVSILTYDNYMGSATINEQLCRTVRSDAKCVVSGTSLCLECSGEVETSVLCSTPDPKLNGACRGPGNYEVGKEGGYEPCCSGLREVFQSSSGYADGNVKACWQPPLRVYACIEGHCGDGRCEDPEGVACGCALDCPRAIWSDEDAGVAGP